MASTCRVSQSYGYLKYLLVVPFLMMVAYGSYKIGYLSSVESNGYEKGTELLRKRRDAIIINSNGNNSYTVMKPGGVVYTRWGRTECPYGSDEIYSGIAGGSNFESHGGGSNYLCLPMDPIWDTVNEAVEKGSKIYGAEYQNPEGFNFEHNEGRSIHDHNVPCVVCHNQMKSSLVMIPARNICYNGWKAEYSGYLMAGSAGHKGRFEYVCMDKSPETDQAGYRNEDGALFYNVEGACGSLPCPPYVQRREITCVVCSK